MNKAETIRFLHSERCSPAEIAAVVGYRESIIRLRLAKPRLLVEERIPAAFRGWRGNRLGPTVQSF